MADHHPGEQVLHEADGGAEAGRAKGLLDAIKAGRIDEARPRWLLVPPPSGGLDLRDSGKPPTLDREAQSEVAFGSGEPFSVGVEEELFLVDPVTGHLANSSAAMQQRLGPVRGRVEPELHACQVELITDVCHGTREAIDALGAMRQAVLETGAGVLGAGTHPSAVEGDAEITDKERYERIRDLLGDAAATPVGGLHIHVGMPDQATAIRAFNGLRRHLPLLQALAANSPFRHGRDTGLASAREVTVRGWPRSGVPRAMHDFDDFLEMASLLTRAADVPDYTWFWWKLRPHPRLGTVELRALDVQTSLESTAGLVALVHCLARHAAETPPESDPPAELIEEGVFRAARYGVQAHLPDAEGRLRPVRELLDDALALAERHARELGCAAELAEVPKLVDSGGGAAAQRESYAIAGTDALLRWLTAETGTGGRPSAGPFSVGP
jgi:glutamate---cysteine ligase / carboxylate-amine ligase